MTAMQWVLLPAGLAAAAGVVWWTYWRRELPARGRPLLAALRWGVLALVVLVLVDPALPRPGRGAEPAPAVVLDASLSMTLPVAPGAAERRWDAGVREAQRRAGGRPVLLAGRQARVVRAEELAELEPDAPGSRLLPALRAAAELGARRVVVISDGGIEDARAVAAWAPRLGLAVEFRQVAEAPLRNRALAELEAPEWAEAGQPVEVRFGVGAAGAEGEALRVVARQDGVEVAEAFVTAPAGGRRATGTLRFTPRPPPGGGWVRLEVALEPGDAVPDDDVRVARIFVTEEPAGVALVSFRPDWEPRFLLPVLARSLGVPVRGYLQSAPGAFLRTGTGAVAGAAAGEDEVRRAVERADLVVLHGVDAEAPAWAQDVLQRGRRLLVFPGEGGAALPAPFALAPAARQTWHVHDELPASPLAGVLAGVDGVDALPLQALHPPPQVPGWAPLNVSAGGRGAPLPALWAGETAGRRWAVALGVGFWQWAFGADAARDLYGRLFGGVAGWLAAGQVAAEAAVVRPAQRVVARGEAIRFLTPGVAADSLAVRLTGADGAVAVDTVLHAAAADTLALRGVAPGEWSWEATAYAAGEPAGGGGGELTVERFSPEFAVDPQELPAVAADPLAPRPTAARARPLRASPWIWVVMLGLLATEWVLRRRRGLR